MIIHPELAVIEQAGDGFAATWKGLAFIVSESTELDGKRWLHASVSRQDKRLPFYDDVLQLWSQNPVGYTPTFVVSFGALVRDATASQT